MIKMEVRHRISTARGMTLSPETSRDRFVIDLFGASPVNRDLCSERENSFFAASPAIASPERAEGVKGPKG
jgi:hypothetical protein